MSSNSVCNHTCDYRTPAVWTSDFVYHSYNYRPDWTTLSPITIIYHVFSRCKNQQKQKIVVGLQPYQPVHLVINLVFLWYKNLSATNGLTCWKVCHLVAAVSSFEKVVSIGF